MTKVHIAKQGFLTKSTIPSVTRSAGVNGVTANTIIDGNDTTSTTSTTEVIDSSSYGRYVSPYGGFPSQVQFSPFGAGVGGSIFFDGFGDWLMLQDSTELQLGTGDFTIECWFYIPTPATIQGLYDQRRGGTSQIVPTLYISASTVRFLVNGIDVLTSGAITLNTWTHVAVVRIGGSTNMYLDGTAVSAPYADTNNYGGNSQRPIVGALSTPASIDTLSSQNSLRGLISNLRVVKGIGVYTGNFTVPTSPLTATQSAGTNIAAISGTETVLLLNGLNYRLVDSSTASPKGMMPSSFNSCPIGGQTNFHPYSGSGKYGSYWFDGQYSYIDIPDNPAWQFLANESYTLEFWIYPVGSQSSASSTRTIIGQWNRNTASEQSFQVHFNAAGNLAAAWTFGGSTTSFPQQSITSNVWTHIVLQKTGAGSVIMAINGTFISSTTFNSTTNNAVQPLRIGNECANSLSSGWTAGLSTAGGTNTVGFQGYLTGIRWVKGVAVYTNPAFFTQAFTPPSIQPLEASGAASAASYPSTTNVNTTFASTSTVLLCKFDRWNMADSDTQPRPIYVNGTAGTTASPSRSGFGPSITKGAQPTQSEIYLPSNVGSFGTGAWTITCWVYINALSSTCNVWSIGNQSTAGGATSVAFSGQIDTSGNVTITRLGSTTTNLASVAGLTGQWVHLAWIRNSNVVRAYVNGVAGAGSLSISTQMGNIGATILNNTADGSAPLPTGGDFVIDNVVFAPQAIWTSNFTPPTSPITDSITNAVYGVYQNY